MPPPYESILAKLDDVTGLVRRPLSEEQISSLEREMGIPAPPGVHAWLTTLGLYTEAGYANASDFEIYQHPQELIESRRAILALLGDRGKDLFPFAHDGAGNEVAVRTGADDDELVFVDHEARQASRHGSFGQWLREVVDEVVETFQAEGAGSQMFWCVQFTFECASERPILDMLQTIAPITARDEKWEAQPTSATGVGEQRIGFAFLGQGRILCRSTHPDWQVPHFSFDYEEPATTPEADSVIRRLDKLFRGQPSLKYKLVDYGPLEWPLKDEDEAPAEPVAAKPWWKFW